MSEKIDKKLLTRFHIEIYKEYLDRSGHSLAKLGSTNFSTVREYSNIPEFKKVTGNVTQFLVQPYVTELKLRGYVSGGVRFQLTPAGFYEGKRLASPIRSFATSNWKFIFPILTGAGLVVVGLLNYFK